MSVAAGGVRIEGECHDRFAGVRTALEENFARRGEIGSAVCIYHEGRKVVDLWADHMDPARAKPWRQDTLCLMYSIAKSICALSLHMVADEGKVDLEAPVVNYWPEFAQNGKEKIRVRDVISHNDGVWATEGAAPGDVYDFDRMVRIIAAQRPEMPGGRPGGYDTVNIGFKASEIVRRVTGQDIRDFVSTRICRPLGANYYLGVPEAKLDLCADLTPNAASRAVPVTGSPEAPAMRAHRCSPKPFDTNEQNGRRFRTNGVASFGGFGEARAMARIYATLAEGGTLDGVKLLSRGAIDRAVVQQWSDRSDGVFGMSMAMSLGFMRPPPDGAPIFGPWPDAFGHLGSGGARAFAVPSRRLAMCFVTNYQTEVAGRGERPDAVTNAACTALA